MMIPLTKLEVIIGRHYFARKNIKIQITTQAKRMETIQRKIKLLYVYTQYK